jgi:UDP-N-acetylglucosamine--N-acetylmuramyl-(pentapeptide) pyrophosphoryl-undecaprenol N-acetylglucosamine transferase
MQTQRILISAGGTGGHLYPAQALAQQLMKQTVPSHVLFVAGGLGSNRHFDRNSFSFQEITCPLLSLHPKKCLKGAIHLFKGIRQSILILKNYQPDVVVGFGSYYTVPILLAAKWLKIPIVLHEANSIPGRANKWLAPLATHVAVNFPSSAAFFKRKTIDVGLPLRNGYQLSAISKESALDYYAFSSERQTLLISGGSQGSRAINELIQECLPVFQKLSLQIIHLTGDSAMAIHLSSFYASHHIPAQVKVFEPQMQMAWRAADAFLGRSGASSIAESLEFEVPGILIPYPYATDKHQEKNADFLVDTVGSAWKLLENQLTSKLLSETIESLYRVEQFLFFKKALADYKKRAHQTTLCQLINNLRR